MADVTIEAVERVFGAILVYFSDDRVSYIGVDILYALSVKQRTLLRSRSMAKDPGVSLE
jgi:hypothetical protein